MRYFLRLMYDGTTFHGWQRQSKHSSIQQTLEEALSTILRRSVQIHGCGRTDGGVHADDYFAHLDLLENESENKIVYRLNKMLPSTIIVKELLPVTAKANAQKDAIFRTYAYKLHLKKDPFLSDISTWTPDLNLNIQILNETAGLLPMYQDFRSFCKTPAKHKSTHCILLNAKWLELEPNQFRFEISSDHFLRGMIRLLVGNMLEVAVGKITILEFQEYLQLKTLPKYFRLAPPQGLHLTAVNYPDELFLS